MAESLILEALAAGLVIGSIVFLVLLIVFAVIALLWLLGQAEVFLAIVQEARAKVVKKFGEFAFAIMSFSGHDFRKNCEFRKLKPRTFDEHGNDVTSDWGYEEVAPIPADRADPWDIVRLRKTTPTSRATLPRFVQKVPILRDLRGIGGLRWIGIPFKNTVHIYRFNWTSLEQRKDDESGMVADVRVSREEELGDILVQEDVYVSESGLVETKDLLPVNVVMLLTIAVVNPRKALFNVQHWLEATHNQVRPAVREYVGTKEYAKLIQNKKASEQELETVLEKGLKRRGQQTVDPGILTRILIEYGVHVRKLQVHAIDPPVEWRETTLQRYVGEQQAARIDAFYAKLAEYGELGRIAYSLETLQKTSSNISFIGKSSDLLPTMQFADIPSAQKRPETSDTQKEE